MGMAPMEADNVPFWQLIFCVSTLRYLSGSRP